MSNRKRGPASGGSPGGVHCYVRVSAADQNEAGQVAEIKRWLRGNGIDPESVTWHVDRGRSGDNLDRPAFGELQGAVFNGEVQTIVVYRVDRLSRSLRDGINTLADWCDRGIRVVSTSQTFDFDGALGKLLASVLFAFGEMEQETRRERQQSGIDVAKQNGVYRGRKRGATSGGRKARKPARAAELRDRGLTVAEIATALGVSRRTVWRYLGTAGGR